MVKSPLLMILDEPCDGLDYANRRNVLEFIEFIGSQTATDLIYVTHHKDELPPCITHALGSGQRKDRSHRGEEGSPAEPYDRGWLVLIRK